IEERMMTDLAAEIEAARDRLREVTAFARELEKGADPTAAVVRRRRRALEQDAARLRDVRARLERELKKVEGWAPAEARLYVGASDALALARKMTDELLRLLPAEQRAVFRQLAAALGTAVEGLARKD